MKIVKTLRGGGRERGAGQDGVLCAHSVLHLILAYKLVAPSEGHSRFDLCTKYALLANQPPLNHPGRATTQLLVAEKTYPPFHSRSKPSPFVLPPSFRTLLSFHFLLLLLPPIPDSAKFLSRIRNFRDEKKKRFAPSSLEISANESRNETIGQAFSRGESGLKRFLERALPCSDGESLARYDKYGNTLELKSPVKPVIIQDPRMVYQGE